MDPMEQPQGHGIPIPTPTSSSPLSDHDLDHDEDNPDFSPVGSPELVDSQPQQPSDQPQASGLSEDLRLKIIRQAFPIGVIASFRKMKKLTRDASLIVAALKESSFLVVSSNGKMVKRLHPLPLAEVKDPMVCTVLVENLPNDHSIENLRRVFGEAGWYAFYFLLFSAITLLSWPCNIMFALNASVKNVTIRDPHDAREPKKCTIAEKLISGKLHALVEYETVEAAEKANKPGQKKKVWRETEPERGNTVQTSEPAHEENHYASEQHDDSHDEEDVDNTSKEKSEVHLLKEKNGQKGRNRGRGRRQKYHNTNGHGSCLSIYHEFLLNTFLHLFFFFFFKLFFKFSGHGTQYGIEPSKPPPGPKMPDGTRGFTIGRGRPLATN
ncbi:hypothetical protein DH2020_017567 [Rehmannia glutinosa]|uniref:HTH La-type RNA-binding domain-containing protein n=1 Tax=Rehmannia glutinosa TaxID=99300 RepID=A0ABR0WUL0_REHGL